MMILLQAGQTIEAAKGILSIESVSAIGVLVLFISFLIWDRLKLINKNEESQKQVFNIMEERLSDIKERLADTKQHGNEISKIRQDFKEMVDQIKEVYGSSKTG